MANISNDDLKLLRFVTGTYSGVVMQIQNSTGDIFFGNTIVNPASGFSNQRGLGYDISSGNLEVASTTGTPMTIGRNESTAGEILQLRKESTVIHEFGSTYSYLLSNVGIGYTNPSYKFQVLSNKAVSLNIGCYVNSQGPSTTNTAFYADASQGTSNNWAFYAASGNSYFANGIRLGGNGSSNELDDYEEGTWTPTISHNNGTGAIPLTVNSATYVKVGKIVHVRAYLTSINPNGNAGGGGVYYAIRSLPFTASVDGAWEVVYANTNMTSYGGYWSGNNLYFMHNGTNGQRSSIHVNGTQFNAFGANASFMFQAVYTTT